MTQEDNMIKHLLIESIGFKKFCRSYFFMITYLTQCLKLLNFTCKVLASYGINNEVKI